MDDTIVLIVCGVVALSDVGLAAYIWLQANKLAAALATPEFQGLAPEQRLKLEAQVKGRRAMACVMGASALIIPFILWYVLTQIPLTPA